MLRREKLISSIELGFAALRHHLCLRRVDRVFVTNSHPSKSRSVVHRFGLGKGIHHFLITSLTANMPSMIDAHAAALAWKLQGNSLSVTRLMEKGIRGNPGTQ